MLRDAGQRGMQTHRHCHLPATPFSAFVRYYSQRGKEYRCYRLLDLLCAALRKHGSVAALEGAWRRAAEGRAGGLDSAAARTCVSWRPNGGGQVLAWAPLHVAACRVQGLVVQPAAAQSVNLALAALSRPLARSFRLQVELLKRQLEPFENLNHPQAMKYCEGKLIQARSAFTPVCCPTESCAVPAPAACPCAPPHEVLHSKNSALLRNPERSVAMAKAG